MTATRPRFSLSYIFALLALTRSAHGSFFQATVVPWRTKVELFLHGDTPLSPLRFHPLENDLVEYLNLALYPYYGVTDATVVSQVLLELSSLRLTWILLGAPSSDNNSSTDFLDQVTKALSNKEFNHILSDEWNLGTVVSAKASLEPETNVILTKDIFDRTGIYSQTTTPGIALRTVSPSALATMSPSTVPDDSLPTDLEILTVTPFPTASPSRLTTMSPSAGPDNSLPTDPEILQNPQTPLFSKMYRANMTINLPGISATITSKETDSVELVAEGFFQDFLPLLHNLILDITSVQVSSQTLLPSAHRRRLGVQESLVLELVIYGEGWSTQQVILDDLPFNSFISGGFETNSKDFLSRLQASSAAFWHLDVLPPTISDKDPSIHASSPESTDDGNQPYMTLVIVVCVCGAIVAGVVGGAFYIFRKMDDTQSVCVEDDIVQDLVDEESLSDSDASRLHPALSRRRSLFKFPIQQSRGNSNHSTKSPSMLWDSDVDNWSLTSVRL